MGGSLFILCVFLAGMIVVAVFIARKNRSEDSYADLDTEEWNCPECGFHIQAGDSCIYCGAEKEKNGHRVKEISLPIEKKRELGD